MASEWNFECCDHLADEQAVFHFWQQILLAYHDERKRDENILWLDFVYNICHLCSFQKKNSLENSLLVLQKMAKELMPPLRCQLSYIHKMK
jgi:3-methyladenine DNA glycosylase AlkD